MRYVFTQDGNLRPEFTSRAERIEYRKLNELCTNCGDELDESADAFTCEACSKKAARYQKRYRRKPAVKKKNYARVIASRETKPDQHRAWRDLRRAHAIASGICVDCSAEAVRGHTECAHHLELGRLHSRRNWRKRHGKLGVVTRTIVDELVTAVLYDQWERAA